MASTNLTSGRPDPRLTGLLGKAASGNAGKYVSEKLPIHFRLTDASYFSGKVRSLPLNQVYGDARVVGTSALKRGPNGEYLNLSRERSFDEVSFECAERAARVLVDQLEIDRTQNVELADLVDIEAVYCFGNCACSPCARIGDEILGEVTHEQLAAAIDSLVRGGADA